MDKMTAQLAVQRLETVHCRSWGEAPGPVGTSDAGLFPEQRAMEHPDLVPKAERFIQTALRDWSYARACNTSKERVAELPK